MLYGFTVISLEKENEREFSILFSKKILNVRERCVRKKKKMDCHCQCKKEEVDVQWIE